MHVFDTEVHAQGSLAFDIRQSRRSIRLVSYKPRHAQCRRDKGTAYLLPQQVSCHRIAPRGEWRSIGERLPNRFYLVWVPFSFRSRVNLVWSGLSLFLTQSSFLMTSSFPAWVTFLALRFQRAGARLPPMHRMLDSHAVISARDRRPGQDPRRYPVRGQQRW
jgi:hypothetical protein